MFYLVMAHDDARGTMVFDAPWYEPDGRMKNSVGRGGPGDYFHAHQRGTAPPRARSAGQLHLQSPLEHLQDPASGDRSSFGRVHVGRRLPARRGGRVRKSVCRRRQRPRRTFCLRRLARSLGAECESFADHLRPDGASCGKENSKLCRGKPTPSPTSPSACPPSIRLPSQPTARGSWSLSSGAACRWASTRWSIKAARLRSM